MYVVEVSTEYHSPKFASGGPHDVDGCLFPLLPFMGLSLVTAQLTCIVDVNRHRPSLSVSNVCSPYLRTLTGEVTLRAPGFPS